MKKYKQLPLIGEKNDYYESEQLLIGMKELNEAINKFYSDNIEYNPRQLHYIVCSESVDTHLNTLLGILK